MAQDIVEIDVPTITKGLYFIVLRTDDGEVYESKLVVK